MGSLSKLVKENEKILEKLQKNYDVTYVDDDGELVSTAKKLWQKHFL